MIRDYLFSLVLVQGWKHGTSSEDQTHDSVVIDLKDEIDNHYITIKWKKIFFPLWASLYPS